MPISLYYVEIASLIPLSPVLDHVRAYQVAVVELMAEELLLTYRRKLSISFMEQY